MLFYKVFIFICNIIIHLFLLQQQQQMMMMLKMQQEQAKNRMSIPPGGPLPPRGIGNPPEVQRIPVSQQGNMPVMINLQGHGAVPPSPDKGRGVPLMVNPQVRTDVTVPE